MTEKGGTIQEHVCPKCGAIYRRPPAVSRVDNQTLICPACGTREALEALGCSPDAQEHILDTIRSFEERRTHHD